MKTLKEYTRLNFPDGYLKRGDDIDMALAMRITEDAYDEETYEKWADGIIQSRHPADIIGNEGIYDTVYRYSRCEPFRYAGQCRPSRLRNLNPRLSQKIYVCSRYRAITPAMMVQNLNDAMEECRRIVEDGDIPIAPHLYFPQFVDDNNECDRAFGIAAGIEALKECTSMHVLIRNEVISEGMENEMLQAANNIGIPITIRYLDQTEKR